MPIESADNSVSAGELNKIALKNKFNSEKSKNFTDALKKISDNTKKVIVCFGSLWAFFHGRKALASDCGHCVPFPSVDLAAMVFDAQEQRWLLPATGLVRGSVFLLRPMSLH